MYFLEGLTYINKTKEPRLYLSGDNDFLKQFVVNVIKDKTKKIPCNYKDMKVNLFYANKFFPVTTDKISNKTGIIIKTASKKASKKELKDNNLEEIVCSTLFPSQVRSFIKICADQYNLTLPKDITDILYNYFKDDLEKIYNYVKVIYYSQLFDNYHIIEEINITSFKLVEYTIKLDLNSVLRSLYNFRDYFGFVWLLILKYKEIGDFMTNPEKYKTPFMVNQYKNLSKGYSKKNVSEIIEFLYLLLEKIKYNNLSNNVILINGITRLKQYMKHGDKKWLMYK